MARSAPDAALVLAAGLGTRLRPLTASRAKPSLPVAGPSLVERVARWLGDGGVRDLLVNLHYRPETVTALLGDGSRLGVRVRYSWEQPILGSAGGPRRAFALTTAARLWIVNGDTICDVALDAMAAAHANSDALVTMAVIPNPDPDRYGGATLDGDIVTGFVPRGRGPSWHFIGVQLAERAAFDALPDGEAAESVGRAYPTLIAGRRGSVRAFQSNAAFHDIGTPADYLAACLHFAAGDPSRLVAATARVSPDADLQDSVVWDDVEVDSGARLIRSIVMSGARVPGGFTAVGQVVAADLTSSAIV
jgi:NDP-sugar pyrophosphorylase family protein